MIQSIVQQMMPSPSDAAASAPSADVAAGTTDFAAHLTLAAAQTPAMPAMQPITLPPTTGSGAGDEAEPGNDSAAETPSGHPASLPSLLPENLPVAPSASATTGALVTDLSLTTMQYDGRSSLQQDESHPAGDRQMAAHQPVSDAAMSAMTGDRSDGTATGAFDPAQKPASVAPAPVAVTAIAVTGAQEAVSSASTQQQPVHQVPQPLPARPERLAGDIGMEISRQLDGGRTQFSLRLDPPELGRIEVKLEMAADGQVRGVVSADNAHTYDLLRRDADNLARALADAGLKADSNALRFDLRQGGQGQPQGFAQNNHHSDRNGTANDDVPPFDMPRHTRRHRGALDLSA